MSTLLEATDNWALKIDRGFVNAVVFLDLKKAFDTDNPWADPGFFQRGGCSFENSRQTFQDQGKGEGGRVGMGEG